MSGRVAEPAEAAARGRPVAGHRAAVVTLAEIPEHASPEESPGSDRVLVHLGIGVGPPGSVDAPAEGVEDQRVLAADDQRQRTIAIGAELAAASGPALVGLARLRTSSEVSTWSRSL